MCLGKNLFMSVVCVSLPSGRIVDAFQVLTVPQTEGARNERIADNSPN